jgi:hypothetical protein
LPVTGREAATKTQSNWSVSGMPSPANSSSPLNENKTKKNRRIIERRRGATTEDGEQERGRVVRGPDPAPYAACLPGLNGQGGEKMISAHLEVVKTVSKATVSMMPALVGMFAFG